MCFRNSTMSGKCPRCKEKCHVAEARVALDEWWHNDCFTCAICSRALDSVSLNECYNTQEIYCRQCYRRHCGVSGFGYGAALISDNGKNPSRRQVEENDKHRTKNVHTVKPCPSSNSRKQRRSKSNKSRQSIATPSIEDIPSEIILRKEKPRYEITETSHTKTQRSYQQAAGDRNFGRSYTREQCYSSCESSIGPESIKSEVTNLSKPRRSIIPAFARPVLPTPPPQEGYWNSLTNLNLSQRNKSNNSLENEASKSKSWELHVDDNGVPENCHLEKHKQSKSFSESESKLSNFMNRNETDINSIHESDTDKSVNAEIDEKLKNIAINVKRSPGTMIFIGPDSQENLEKLWKMSPSQQKIEDKKKTRTLTTKEPGKKYEYQSNFESDSQNPQGRTPVNNDDIIHGLVKLNYSDPVKPDKNNASGNGDLNNRSNEEDHKSSISFSTNKSIHEERLFAMAVENKERSNKKEPITNNSVATSDLESLDEEYNKLVTTIIKPQAIEVKNSRSELNRSFEHMKTFSQSKLQVQLHISNSNDSVTRKDGKLYCRGCGMEIHITEPNIINLNPDLAWHSKCFICSKCYIKLNERNYFLKEKWLFCMTHYAEAIHAPKCEACLQYILESSYTIAKGKTWHKDHFKCTNCKVSIIDSKFVTLFLEQVVCFICYEKYFSKKCETCGNKIKPTEQFIYHNQYYWHAKDDCLNCDTCKQGLVGRQMIFFKDGIPYCSKYCAIRKDSIDIQ